MKTVKELKEERTLRLKAVDTAYYDKDSIHYRDNERYRWAVKTIDERFNKLIEEAEKLEIAMSKQLYFNYSYDDFCRTEEAWRTVYEDEPGSTIELTEAEIDTGTKPSWCNELGLIIDSGDCGKHCQQYTPINGVKGKCRYKGHFYRTKLDEHGKPVKKIITI